MGYLIASVGLIYFIGFFFLGLIFCRFATARLTPGHVISLLALSFLFTWIVFRTQLFLYLSLQLTVYISLACLFIYTALLAFQIPSSGRTQEKEPENKS